jgi:hypothetical protein
MSGFSDADWATMSMNAAHALLAKMHNKDGWFAECTRL